MASFGPSTYITPSTTIGLNPKLPLRSGTGKNQASSSRLTFCFVTCVSAEYCIESAAPP